MSQDAFSFSHMPLHLNTPSQIQGNINQMVERLSQTMGRTRSTGHARTSSYPLIRQSPPPPMNQSTSTTPPTTTPLPTQVNDLVLELGDVVGGANGEGEDTMANMRAIWRASQYALPFILLILCKLLYHHRLGILVLIGLSGTFYHANSGLKKQTTQRDGRSSLDSLGNLIWIVVFLSGNIFFIYYVFDDQKLYRSLYLQVPSVDPLDLWNLLWIVGITDFIIKYSTIMLKAVIALLPRRLLAFKKKGKYYMLLEHGSQLYRCLVPVTPWLLFLVEGPGPYLNYLLVLAYLPCKAAHLWVKVKEVHTALTLCHIDVSYGSAPSKDRLQGEDQTCPICQDKLQEPVQLTCQHIFCEDCVSMWFSREPTCPMCRAKIVDDPTWRDGGTAGNLQVY